MTAARLGAHPSKESAVPVNKSRRLKRMAMTKKPFPLQETQNHLPGSPKKEQFRNFLVSRCLPRAVNPARGPVGTSQSGRMSPLFATEAFAEVGGPTDQRSIRTAEQ
jgi:hypothetical protein